MISLDHSRDFVQKRLNLETESGHKYQFLAEEKAPVTEKGFMIDRRLGMHPLDTIIVAVIIIFIDSNITI